MRWLVLALVLAGFLELAMDGAVAMKVASAEKAQMGVVGGALGGLGSDGFDGGEPRLIRVPVADRHRRFTPPHVRWGPIATLYTFASMKIRRALHHAS